MNDQRLKSLIESVIKSIVDYPTSVAIEMNKPHDGLCEIIIYGHLSDLKMIIGKGGKNIQALRTLVYAMAAKTKMRCYISVEENLGMH